MKETEKKIMDLIAKTGKGSSGLLAGIYVQKGMMSTAMKKLIFMNLGTFARGVIIDAMGMGGGPNEVENIMMRFFDYDKSGTNPAYPCLRCLGGKEKNYYADEDEEIRNKALFAIENMLKGEEYILSTESGRALVQCIFLDSSEKAGITAARIVGDHATSATFSLLLTTMINAEKNGEDNLIKKGETAIWAIVENMKIRRPRGSFLKPLMGLSNASENMWEIGEKTILKLFSNSRIKNEMYQMVVNEMKKLEGAGLGDNRIAIKRMGCLIESMGRDFTISIRKGKRVTNEKYRDGEFMRPPHKMMSGGNRPVGVSKCPVNGNMHKTGKKG